MPSHDDLGRVLVCIPTYDEAEALPIAVAAVLSAQPRVDLLVIDDDSPDGTGRIADGLAARDARVHVLHRAGKSGLGAAYRAGFAWGLARGYDVLVEMDADGSHRAEDLGALLDAARTADVVLGTRWMRGGRTVGWPVRRRLLSVAGSLYARLLLGLPLRDITGGFRVYRAAALERLGYAAATSEGYCFQIELADRAHRAGLTIRQVPIVFVERAHGSSKMSGAVVAEAIRNVTTWGLRRSIVRLRTAPAAVTTGPR